MILRSSMTFIWKSIEILAVCKNPLADMVERNTWGPELLRPTIFYILSRVYWSQPCLEMGQRWKFLCKAINICCHLVLGCFREISIWTESELWIMEGPRQSPTLTSVPSMKSISILFHRIGEQVTHVISNHPCSPHFCIALNCYVIYLWDIW